MYGYQIGQILGEGKMSVWTGIKLPSIYKAMQSLEDKQCISPQEISDGNNPPRTVYSITPAGRTYLKEMLNDALKNINEPPHEFWLALSFSSRIFSKTEIEQYIQSRIEHIRDCKQDIDKVHCEAVLGSGIMPFAHRHLGILGERFRNAQVDVLQDLLKSLDTPEYDIHFIDKGEY